MTAPTDTDRTLVREARTRAGLTQAQLAVYAGLSTGAVQRVEGASEDEVGNIPLGTLVKLAVALEVAPVSLYPRLGRKA